MVIFWILVVLVAYMYKNDKRRKHQEKVDADPYKIYGKSKQWWELHGGFKNFEIEHMKTEIRKTRDCQKEFPGHPRYTKSTLAYNLYHSHIYKNYFKDMDETLKFIDDNWNC